MKIFPNYSEIFDYTFMFITSRNENILNLTNQIWNLRALSIFCDDQFWDLTLFEKTFAYSNSDSWEIWLMQNIHLKKTKLCAVHAKISKSR